MKWVEVDGYRMNRDSVLSIVRFLENFQSKQCARFEKLNDVVKELNLRGASIEAFSFKDEAGGC